MELSSLGDRVKVMFYLVSQFSDFTKKALYYIILTYKLQRWNKHEALDDYY